MKYCLEDLIVIVFSLNWQDFYEIFWLLGFTDTVSYSQILYHTNFFLFVCYFLFSYPIHTESMTKKHAPDFEVSINRTLCNEVQWTVQWHQEGSTLSLSSAGCCQFSHSCILCRSYFTPSIFSGVFQLIFQLTPYSLPSFVTSPHSFWPLAQPIAIVCSVLQYWTHYTIFLILCFFHRLCSPVIGSRAGS